MANNADYRRCESLSVLGEVLPAQECGALLDCCIRSAAGRNLSFDCAPDLIPFRNLFIYRIMQCWERAKSTLVNGDFLVSSIEMDLRVCHEGTGLGADDDRYENRARFVSFYYFLHQEPRAFSGGEIRLWEIDREDKQKKLTGRRAVVHPVHNHVAFFESRLAYEVLPAGYPSEHIADRLFTVSGCLRR